MRPSGNYARTKAKHTQLGKGWLRENCRVDNKDRIVLRFLQGNGFNYEKTIKSLDEHLEWRIKSLPVELEDVETEVQQGLLYFFGRDKRYRPVLHIAVKRLTAASVAMPCNWL